MVGHCLGEAPFEGCGLIAFDGDTVVNIYPTPNQDASASVYTIPPQMHFDALADAETRGWNLGGVFHSHPRGAAVPSLIDINGALDPSWVHIVIGLKDNPEVKAWRIGEGEAFELDVVVLAGGHEPPLTAGSDRLAGGVWRTDP